MKTNDITDIEKFADKMAQIQDSGEVIEKPNDTLNAQNSERFTSDRARETFIQIPTYEKYWIYSKPYGHDIVISAKTGKTTIQCKWPDRIRNASGRVSDKK